MSLQRTLNHCALGLVGIVLVARSLPTDDLFGLSQTAFLGVVFGWLVSRDSQKLDLLVPASILCVGLGLASLIGDDALQPVVTAGQLQLGGLIAGASASALLRVGLERLRVGEATRHGS